MSKFKIDEIDFHIPLIYRGMSKKYMLSRIFDDKTQKLWKPKTGDIMIGCTGNIFVISSSTLYNEDLGGRMFFFGGGLGMDEEHNRVDINYKMNEKGINKFQGVYNVNSFSDFRYIPYPHE